MYAIFCNYLVGTKRQIFLIDQFYLGNRMKKKCNYLNINDMAISLTQSYFLSYFGTFTIYTA